MLIFLFFFYINYYYYYSRLVIYFVIILINLDDFCKVGCFCFFFDFPLLNISAYLSYFSLRNWHLRCWLISSHQFLSGELNIFFYFGQFVLFTGFKVREEGSSLTKFQDLSVFKKGGKGKSGPCFLKVSLRTPFTGDFSFYWAGFPFSPFSPFSFNFLSYNTFVLYLFSLYKINK